MDVCFHAKPAGHAERAVRRNAFRFHHIRALWVRHLLRWPEHWIGQPERLTGYGFCARRGIITARYSHLSECQRGWRLTHSNGSDGRRIRLGIHRRACTRLSRHVDADDSLWEFPFPAALGITASYPRRRRNDEVLSAHGPAVETLRLAGIIGGPAIGAACEALPGQLRRGSLI